jgi:two-component system chemotaxis response regulator CheY
MLFLIIDDSVPMRRIVANVLARLGHTDVVLAPNGRDALRRLETEQIDFVITDWYMPEMTGLEFLRHVRANPATRDVPILIVTANGSKADVTQAVKLGVDGYILKPFTADFLKERIEAICAGRAQGDAASAPDALACATDISEALTTEPADAEPVAAS